MTTRSNDPSLWKQFLPKPKAGGHKYDRGVAVIYGAPKMTGATRLAAEACARVGAGLVKVIAPEGTGDIYRASLPAHIIVEDEMPDFSKAQELLKDQQCRALLLGPGCPPDPFYKSIFEMALKDLSMSFVLDAGAFLSLKDGGFNSDVSRVAVTPHEGEFQSFFGSGLGKTEKISMAEEAVSRLNATIVLKGAQTVIAGDGNTIVQNRDVPSLSTAGTGDVLAGMIAGLIAQGMEVQMASATAVWIHAEAAARFGPGLVASDLPGLIPPILNELSAA